MRDAWLGVLQGHIEEVKPRDKNILGTYKPRDKCYLRIVTRSQAYLIERIDWTPNEANPEPHLHYSQFTAMTEFLCLQSARGDVTRYIPWSQIERIDVERVR